MLCFCVDWIDENSIGHDPLICIDGGGLILAETPLRLIFQVSHEFRIVRIGIQKARSEQDFLSGMSEVQSEVSTWVGSLDLSRNSRQSELPTFVGTLDVGITPDTRADFFRLPESPDTRRNFRQSEVPTTRHLSDGITSSSGLRIRHSIYVS